MVQQEESSPSSLEPNTTDDSSGVDLWALEEVDMNNPMMDPLEWTARKLIPIPTTYYWDQSSTPVSSLPWKLKVWHRSVAALGAVVQTTDAMGKSIANTLGLSSSRFDYVTDNMTEADWEYSRRQVAERKRLYALNRAENGGADQVAQSEDTEGLADKTEKNLSGLEMGPEHDE